MIKSIRVVILGLVLTLGLSALAETKPKYGPIGAKKDQTALLLARSLNYVRTHRARTFWALMPYYVGMFDGHSASPASLSMVLNGILRYYPYTAADEMVTASGILTKTKVEEFNWTERLTPKVTTFVQGDPSIDLSKFRKGYTKEEKKVANEKTPGGFDTAVTITEKPVGVNLDEMTKLVAKSLADAGKNLPDKGLSPKFEVSAIHVNSKDAQSVREIRNILIESEKSNNSFLIANYKQSEFTGDPEGAVGTYSPVGAFDAQHDQVLIMETDRTYYEPYWVSLETFVAGLNTADDESPTLNRGLVYIKRR